MKLFAKFSLVTLVLMAFLIIGATGALAIDKKDLLVYYPCDDGNGTTLKDESGNGWDAEINGNTYSWEKGKHSGCLELKKTCATVENEPIIKAVNDTGEITLCCWCYIKSLTNYNGLISMHGDPGGEATNCDYRLMINGGKNPFWNMGHHADKSLATFTFDTDTWYFFAITGDGKTAKIYIDGKSVGEVAENFALPDFDTVTLLIGAGEGPGTWVAEDMMLDDIMIWSKALEENDFTVIMKGNR